MLEVVLHLYRILPPVTQRSIVVLLEIHPNLSLSLSTVTMAVPPAYSDLGKSAKDIFSKGYGKSVNPPDPTHHHHTQEEREDTITYFMCL